MQTLRQDLKTAPPRSLKLAYRYHNIVSTGQYEPTTYIADTVSLNKPTSNHDDALDRVCSSTLNNTEAERFCKNKANFPQI
jgi:hypothetical protein